VDVEIPSFGKLDEAEFDILLFEFRHDLGEYFRTQMPDGPFKTLADVIEYNARHAATMMPIFGQDLMVKSWEKGPLASPAYRKAVATSRRLSRAGGIDATLRKHRVEAIVALTSPPAWFIDVVNGDSARGGCTQLPAMAGYPHVTVPAGFAGGLPVGLSFFGTAFTDAKLLGLARAFERATMSRRPPG
jgi:amidase